MAGFYSGQDRSLETDYEMEDEHYSKSGKSSGRSRSSSHSKTLDSRHSKSKKEKGQSDTRSLPRSKDKKESSESTCTCNPEVITIPGYALASAAAQVSTISRPGNIGQPPPTTTHATASNYTTTDRRDYPRDYLMTDLSDLAIFYSLPRSSHRPRGTDRPANGAATSDHSRGASHSSRPSDYTRTLGRDRAMAHGRSSNHSRSNHHPSTSAPRTNPPSIPHHQRTPSMAAASHRSPGVRAVDTAETIYATVNRATARRTVPGALPLSFNSLNFYSRSTLVTHGNYPFAALNTPTTHPLAALDTPTSHPRRAP